MLNRINLKGFKKVQEEYRKDRSKCKKRLEVKGRWRLDVEYGPQFETKLKTERAGEITVQTVVPDHFQGYPGIVHGGIVASLVDEALGRVHLGPADNPRFMFTAKMSINYRKPIPTEKPIRIVAHAVKNKRRSATSKCAIYDLSGDVLAEAEAVLVNVPDEKLTNTDYESLGWKVYPESEEKAQ